MLDRKVEPVRMEAFCPKCRTKRQDAPTYWLRSDGLTMVQDCACPPRTLPAPGGPVSAS